MGRGGKKKKTSTPSLWLNLMKLMPQCPTTVFKKTDYRNTSILNIMRNQPEPSYDAGSYVYVNILFKEWLKLTYYTQP